MQDMHYKFLPHYSYSVILQLEAAEKLQIISKGEM